MSYHHLHRLFCSLLLLGILAVHTGLLVHVYEHDAARLDAECQLCLAGPAFKATGAVAAAMSAPAVLPAPLRRSCTPKLSSTRTAFEARAPPRPA